MKLLTHNFLSSRFLKNVTTGYPLKLTIEEKNVVEAEIDVNFLKNVMVKIDYAVLYEAAKSVGEDENLPSPNAIVDIDSLNEQQLKQLHRVLVCLDVVIGSLECPETGRIFPIRDGIPNLLVNEDEVS
ncbi:hypothetical protein PRIPAC_79011 [Pristionchus pacificus]|uniref:Multifunctional methyltransferase subunit TRM112-like protein n=1 Tax=Pristionchus pacificus TaxID=54126 RepID=A0A2A6BYH7_PRIPA|nr:hypothetical protein PRIPAC_79011 [Pristionchus pacificus]|eukprot:PDM70919.1 hypothetical protein PRIPAC_44315 [Pristionchus pacificus]